MANHPPVSVCKQQRSCKLEKNRKKSANRSETQQMRKLCGEVGRSAAKCIGAAQVMRLALHKAARNHLRTA